MRIAILLLLIEILAVSTNTVMYESTNIEKYNMLDLELICSTFYDFNSESYYTIVMR